MRITADAVVIGGGPTGTSIAYHLAAAGLRRVQLVEAATPGASAARRSSALVRRHAPDPHQAELARQSFPYFKRWRDLVGPGDPGYVRTGAIRLVASGQEACLRENVEMLQRGGIDTYLIDRDDLRAIDRGLEAADVEIAAFEVEAGYADPVATALSFAARATALGATIRGGVTAIEIRQRDGRVSSVETSAGRIATERVILAAAASTDLLLRGLGLDLGLQTHLVQRALLRPPAPHDPPHPTIIDTAAPLTLRPDGAHGTLAITPLATPSAGVAALRHRLARRRPALAGARLRDVAVGGLTTSPDDRPIVDEVLPGGGLFVVAGGSDLDLSGDLALAPALGRGIAEWIVDGAPWSIDLSPFGLARFATPAALSTGPAHMARDRYREPQPDCVMTAATRTGVA